MLTLGVTPPILARGFRGGFAVDAGGVVVRVTHARRGEAGQPGIEVRAQLRGCNQLAHAHSVGALSAPYEAALAGPVGVGEFTVRIYPHGAPLGDFFQLIRAQLGCLFGQETLSALDDVDRDVPGQVAHKSLNHPQVLLIQRAGPPRLRSRRQFGRQSLASHGDPWRELLSVAQPAPRFGGADPRPVGDHLVHRTADVGGILFG